MPPLAGERWYAVPKGGDDVRQSDWRGHRIYSLLPLEGGVTAGDEDSGFSAKIRGPQGPDMTQKQIAAK